MPCANEGIRQGLYWLSDQRGISDVDRTCKEQFYILTIPLMDQAVVQFEKNGFRVGIGDEIRRCRSVSWTFTLYEPTC